MNLAMRRDLSGVEPDELVRNFATLDQRHWLGFVRQRRPRRRLFHRME